MLTIAGGVLVLFFSVLPFVSYTDGRFVAVAGRTSLATSWTAWSSTTFMAPASWLAILSAVLVAGLGMSSIRTQRPAVLGVDTSQLQFGLGAMSFLIIACLAVSQKTVLFGDDRPQLTPAGVKVDATLSLDLGGYLMLLAALLMLIGALLAQLGRSGPVIWPLSAGPRNQIARAGH